MKILLALVGIIGTGILFVVIAVSMLISFHNKEVVLRNEIVAKQTDNKNQMDAMWKIIDQNAQVTVMQKNALMDIFNGYAQARTGDGNASLMKWVQESIPNIDQSTYKELMNIITAQREGFKTRQTELLDKNREHNNLLDVFPGDFFAWILGVHKIDVIIVTSTRTENAFQTGKDDDVALPGVQRTTSTNK